MRSKRSFIDYSLDKRATLIALFRGATDACDADPYLMRAAKFHGEKAGRNCPVCKKDELVELRYTYGDHARSQRWKMRITGNLSLCSV